MLPRSQRISIHRFEAIIKNGGFHHSPFFILRFTKTREKSGFAVSVPKKVAKTATERNKIKRRIYSILKDLIPKLKQPIDMVFIMKSGSEKLSYSELEREIQEIFVKTANLK